MYQAASTMTDTGGTSRLVTFNSANLACGQGLATTDAGIMIGTGTTVVAMTDTKLVTQVTTNITYGASVITAENPNASTWRAAIARPFTNSTGSVLNVTEVGLVSRGYDGSANRNFIIDRTLYSISIPNGATVTITYRITITL